MIRVTVQVASGSARFKVAVRAENIRRALEFVEGNNPGCEARVAFPIDPDGFFVGEPVETPALVESEEAA